MHKSGWIQDLANGVLNLHIGEGDSLLSQIFCSGIRRDPNTDVSSDVAV